MFGWLLKSRRQRLLSAPFPPAWETVLERNVAHCAVLPADLLARLRDKLRIIVAERRFAGAQGLIVTEEMRVTIAAQAALLLLGVEGYFFDRVPVIVLLPGSFSRRAKRLKQHGVNDERGLLGEAVQGDGIRLSWPDALDGGLIPDDGENLVLHEFAHHLDGLDGEMGGAPPQDTPAKQQRWEAVIAAEYGQLLAAADVDEETLLDPYGAESKAEFFAVATECFYEQPRELADEHPDLYAVLRDFFHVDPASWNW